jgi:hypothetical protein
VKNFAVVCLLVFAAALPVYAQIPAAQNPAAQQPAAELSPFELANRIGEPNERTFFLFSTSVGNYALRQDGMGEITSAAGMRKVFNVKVGPGRRIERVYSFEYQGDVLLLYETTDSGYLVRLSQKTKKVKASIAVSRDFTPPAIKDQRIVFGDGTVVSLD